MTKYVIRPGVLAATVAVLAGSSAIAADMVNQQNADSWRASKLVGVAIYGPDDKNVGKVDDVILGKDGKAQQVVIGVGGFLGVGQKDVAVPYEQVKFSDEPVKASTASAPAPASTGSTASGGSPANPPAQSAASASSAKPGAYPDHGTIDMTYDQLKNAPDFKFAS